MKPGFQGICALSLPDDTLAVPGHSFSVRIFQQLSQEHLGQGLAHQGGSLQLLPPTTSAFTAQNLGKGDAKSHCEGANILLISMQFHEFWCEH